MIGVSLIVSSLVERMCRGKRVPVQPKTVVRISHHCGFAGTSQTTIPSLSPVASASAMWRSPSASTFTATTRPVRGNHLFSIPVRSDCIVSATSESLKDFTLSKEYSLHLFPENLPEETIAEYKDAFEGWIVTNGLRELIEGFSAFLDNIWELTFLACQGTVSRSRFFSALFFIMKAIPLHSPDRSQVRRGSFLIAVGRRVALPLFFLCMPMLVQPCAATPFQWAYTGSLNTARHHHTATLLPDGMVLVAGGFDTSAIASAELYDPTSGTW